MKKLIWIIAVIAFPLHLYADGDVLVAGARYAGMAGSSVVINDHWSVFGNQAGLAAMNKAGAGIAYENRFMLRETGYGAGVFQSPLFSGNIGVGITNFGYTDYHENKFALAYAQQLFKRIAMGVQMDYFYIHQPENYGNLHAFSFEAGVLTRPTDKISVGFHAANPIPLQIIGARNQYLPTVLKLGFGYNFTKNIIVSIEGEKNLQVEAPVFRLGFEYRSENHYSLRAGIANKPVMFALGFGYEFKHFQLDLAYSYHQVLGSTPHISLSYAF